MHGGGGKGEGIQLMVECSAWGGGKRRGWWSAVHGEERSCDLLKDETLPDGGGGVIAK